MKAKSMKWVKTAALFGAVLVLCYGIFYFGDYILNGSFVDWFQDNYVWTHTEPQDTSGLTMTISEINWPKFKMLILELFCLGALLSAALAAGAARFYGKKMSTRTISGAGRMIHSFMEHDIDADMVFPTEYAEIAVQMTQIKTKMERNARIMKEEEARKNDMITYLAHDLKTPLTSIIGYLSLLDEARDMPALQREKYTTIVFEKSLLLERLIQEFFDITRYNLNQIILEKETLDLSYMLVQMADEFYPILQKWKNSIDLDVGEGITVYGDTVKLARVFQNILKNAAAYSYPESVIRVKAEKDDKEVRVTIENAGKTIPKEKLPVLFDKFYRADEARQGNTGGAGLGLAIAKEIVVLHGGSITADSKNEKTTFLVSLPQI
ncbi:two-component system sensor histidine kinase VanS [Faecalicatena orotica]|uniref:histidine kinase n=2 Tax=Faecalicatena orotica TaxID=1544 RepID=A0A2Y9BHS3_9FIRM|nr:two-component system sensor histidine kinase VanS [Faecalicatena orotica]SSA56440.1 two-component system, OmpR family, sensor histidine kinase VanS [Faecalicatena orotica]